MNEFFIGESDFKVWLPSVSFEKAKDLPEDAFNSRRINGVMSTERTDRQGESVIAKGLDFSDFLNHGHYNDNHSQETSAIVGFPEKVSYHKDLSEFGCKAEGWSCEGYVLKGTKRSDALWELAKALETVPNRKLGFSIEGKVIRRNDKTIEKAKIRNVAITNCPVNTDCTWAILAKSFEEPEIAMKAMTAGYGTSPGSQSGGGAVRAESLESDLKVLSHEEKRKKRKKFADALQRAFTLDFEEMMKSMDWILERRPDMDEEAAAYFIHRLYQKGGRI